MPRSKDDFFREFRARMVGMALYGATKEVSGGVLARATHAYEICGNIDDFMKEIYDYIVSPAEQQPPPVLPPRQPAPQQNNQTRGPTGTPPGQQRK